MNGAKILVVDDESYISTPLEEYLSSIGHNVVARGSSGEEAVIYAREMNPDLILMDIVMPGPVDGIDEVPAAHG